MEKKKKRVIWKKGRGTIKGHYVRAQIRGEQAADKTGKDLKYC